MTLQDDPTIPANQFTDGAQDAETVDYARYDVNRVETVFTTANSLQEASEKVCRVCKETKSLLAFHKDKNSPDGHMAICKVCRSDPPVIPPRPMWYPFNRAALDRHREFLQQYAYGTMWRKPAVIVSLPIAERETLIAFCTDVGLDLAAVYDLPRQNSAEDRVGVILFGVRLREVKSDVDAS